MAGLRSTYTIQQMDGVARQICSEFRVIRHLCVTGSLAIISPALVDAIGVVHVAGHVPDERHLPAVVETRPVLGPRDRRRVSQVTVDVGLAVERKDLPDVGVNLVRAGSFDGRLCRDDDLESIP
jgi:hypothetical protein